MTMKNVLIVLLLAGCAAQTPTPQTDPGTVRPVTANSKADSITITGTVTTEGAECPAVRGDDGKLYTIAGDREKLVAGARVRITGTVAEMTYCMQGITINATTIEVLTK